MSELKKGELDSLLGDKTLIIILNPYVYESIVRGGANYKKRFISIGCIKHHKRMKGTVGGKDRIVVCMCVKYCVNVQNHSLVCKGLQIWGFCK